MSLLNDPLQVLKDYVSHASVSADPSFAEGMVGARDFITARLRELGFAVEVVQTPMHPVVLATRGDDPSWPHLVLYGHYDVQPPDPLSLWDTPAFEPEERGGRLYARGAADNKGPQIVHMAALARALEKNPELPLRITYLIEGEEEIGSPSFKGFLEQYKDRLKAEMVLVSDTGSPSPEQLVVTTGLRGLTAMEVRLTGPKQDLHSGVHGGALLNPLQALSELCASLHGPDGRVNVPGFYDSVREPEDWEREELNKLPLTEEVYAEFLGIEPGCFHPPAGFTALEALRFAPTLEFNGMGGGYQGEGSKTVIPSEVFAKITCRLVPNQTEEEIAALVRKTIEERCPPQVTCEVNITGGGDPYIIIPPGKPGSDGNEPALLKRAFAAAETRVEEIFGSKPIYLREGGSIPIICDLKNVVGLDSLLIGLFTNDDNLHAPNESFHLGIMAKAIDAFEKLFLDLAAGE